MTIAATYSSQSGAQIKYEARRQFVVKAVFFIFTLSLVEGPLRKWLLPGLSGPLTLLRDPFIIALYAYCLQYGLMLRRGLAALWLSFALITSAVGLAQYAVAGLPTWGWMLGVRTYWLYMPLAFVVAKTFTREDIHRFLKLCLWISIPYSFLVATQYNAPLNAFINLGVGGDDEAVVGLGDGILRPFGLFTYTGPNVQFTAFMIAVFVAFYVDDVPMRRRQVFLMVSGAAVGTMSVLTGSRSIYFLAGSIIGLTLFGMLVSRPSRRNLRRSVGIMGFVFLAGWLFIAVFPDMLEAMVDRFNRAAQVEGSIWNRAFGGLIAWIDPLFTAPLLGMGIGAGAPGVARMLGLPSLIYGEGDLQRNINELGIFVGIFLVGMRFVTSAFILRLAFSIRRKGVGFLGFPVAAFSSYQIGFAQITHSPINAFLPWLLFGFLLAIERSR